MKYDSQDGDVMTQGAVPRRRAASVSAAPSRLKDLARRTAWVILLLALTLACAALGASWRRSHRELAAAESELLTLRDKQARSTDQLKELREQKMHVEQDLHGAHASELDLAARLAAAEGRLGQVEEEHSFVEEQLSEFRRMTRLFESMIDSGRLDVSFRRGRMVLELPALLLFPSGDADLTPEGKAALVQVAEILRGVHGQRFVVAGHTDRVPVSGSRFANNWDLSVARALHVTEALIAAGVRPQQLMAAGRGQYEPVASNATARGRQRNRRIEIVLEPYLVEVDQAIEAEGEVDVD